MRAKNFTDEDDLRENERLDDGVPTVCVADVNLRQRDAPVVEERSEKHAEIERDGNVLHQLLPRFLPYARRPRAARRHAASPLRRASSQAGEAHWAASLRLAPRLFSRKLATPGQSWGAVGPILLRSGFPGAQFPPDQAPSDRSCVVKRSALDPSEQAQRHVGRGTRGLFDLPGMPRCPQRGIRLTVSNQERYGRVQSATARP